MRSIGVMLASLLTTRCGGGLTRYAPLPPTRTPTPPMPTCYTVVPLVTPSPPPAGKDEDWDRLRQPWYSLDRLARDAQDSERGEQTQKRLVAEHRAALDRLVQAGALDRAIADEMQTAFESAAYHVWRANAPITCYEFSPDANYQIEGSSDLVKQSELLAEMAEKSAIDEATVAQAKAAIERDIAFLTMSAEAQHALIEATKKATGNTGTSPHLADLALNIPPESVEAAHILVELLLGKKIE
jgi:hypothetical protein